MSDLLVKLYQLPDTSKRLTALRERGVEIRPAVPTEGALIAGWVARDFKESWGRAAAVAAMRHPSTCYIAIEPDERRVGQDPYDLPGGTLVGFACYDADILGMFGPIGVRPDRQDRGIGTGLLHRTLRGMAENRYAYAIIGWADRVDWYAREVGATVIDGSEPGPFRGPLRTD